MPKHCHEVSCDKCRLTQHPPFVLFDNSISSDTSRGSLLFKKPEKILEAFGPEDLPFLFHGIEEAIKKGKFLAGYWTYEWGYCMEPRLKGLLDRHRPQGPLVWLGIFNAPEKIKIPLSYDYCILQKYIASPSLLIDCSEKHFKENIESIKSYIAAGHTYQVNYTVRGKFEYNGSAEALYLYLRQHQQVQYGAYISHDNRKILSFSPELFFKRDGDILTSKPMKGTFNRGSTEAEDKFNKDFLENDIKNRAENVMIVDLLRNDIGRISKMGRVSVPELFTIETYETLFQMTSTVNGCLCPDVSWQDIFKAIYPCGSITGAPKIRTMEIIAELESSPRGVYTGAIGYITPENKAIFNVGIRTIVIEDGRGEMGIGSGITYDSDPEDEFKETLLKSKFFSSNITCT